MGLQKLVEDEKDGVEGVTPSASAKRAFEFTGDELLNASGVQCLAHGDTPPNG
ncbi:hypothetical protein [Deinococcus metallilatus]|uniref:Uncharacterized protein n=1 Tax=Deinococcus metallilatus TaxID=1211322 RepID=A0ABR6MR85_9DEIO|nr:hypothetical protein [Deinococcus metallilatus]MBB5293860.1 hypothetical protein [Deinococcus metallilatus]GMA17792.1 hypothetical protein GCM10025871_41230 [Deinococcus metallilatus]